MNSSSSISRSLRDQVVQLSIDIDDKTKISKLLEKKIKQERLELSQIEEVCKVVIIVMGSGGLIVT